MRFRTAKSIDVFPFGHVKAPLQVNDEGDGFETTIDFDINDLNKLVDSSYWYYALKGDQTHRQQEIAELFGKLRKLLRKEKSVIGRIWSPIVVSPKCSNRE